MKSIRLLKQYSISNKKKNIKLERKLIQFLKEKKHAEYQRQKVIGYYIVDFIFKRRKLIVEMYEGFHKEQEAYDLRRQKYLEGLGFHFLIIKENDNFDEKLQEIYNYPRNTENWKFCVQTIQTVNARGYLPKILPKRKKPVQNKALQQARSQLYLNRRRILYGY